MSVSYAKVFVPARVAEPRAAWPAAQIALGVVWLTGRLWRALSWAVHRQRPVRPMASAARPTA